jgi:hypothetical protein
MANERHVYVIPGVVSDEKYREIGVKATTEDSDLTYYVHFHRFDPVKHSGNTCNGRCESINGGRVERVLPDLVDSVADRNGDKNG